MIKSKAKPIKNRLWKLKRNQHDPQDLMFFSFFFLFEHNKVVKSVSELNIKEKLVAVFGFMNVSNKGVFVR